MQRPGRLSQDFDTDSWYLEGSEVFVNAGQEDTLFVAYAYPGKTHYPYMKLTLEETEPTEGTASGGKTEPAGETAASTEGTAGGETTHTSGETFPEEETDRAGEPDEE